MPADRVHEGAEQPAAMSARDLCLDPEVCNWPSGRCVEPSRCKAPTAATPSPADTIRTALQGAMVGAWGRENALRALSEMEAENERLRKLLARFENESPKHIRRRIFDAR